MAVGRPWPKPSRHAASASYLAASPAEADQLLDRVLRVRGLRPELLGQLHQVRAFRAWQQQDCPPPRRHAPPALRASPAVRGNRGLWSDLGAGLAAAHAARGAH
jgi:hypothetical protein